MKIKIKFCEGSSNYGQSTAPIARQTVDVEDDEDREKLAEDGDKKMKKYLHDHPYMEPDGLQEEEAFQKAVKKDYRKMKFRLVGKGGNKYVSSGMKKPSYARSKSAPVGFGGSLEENKE